MSQAAVVRLQARNEGLWPGWSKSEWDEGVVRKHNSWNLELIGSGGHMGGRSPGRLTRVWTVAICVVVWGS